MEADDDCSELVEAVMVVETAMVCAAILGTSSNCGERGVSGGGMWVTGDGSGPSRGGSTALSLIVSAISIG